MTPNKWQWCHTVEAARLAVLWILKRLLFNRNENVTSEEESKMTASFQSRSRSRGLNCLFTPSLSLPHSPCVWISHQIWLHSESRCLLLVNTRVTSVKVMHRAAVLLVHTRGRHYSLIDWRGVRSAVTHKCSGVYWRWQLTMTGLPSTKMTNPGCLHFRGTDKTLQSLGKSWCVTDIMADHVLQIVSLEAWLVLSWPLRAYWEDDT